MALLTKPKHFMLDGQFGVNVKDFGPPGMVGNGDPVYDGPAFIKAAAYLNTNSEGRGGRFVIPRGSYRPTQTFDVADFSIVQNIYVEGEGEINTQVLGDAMPAGSDVFRFNNGAHFGIKGMMIANAKRNGVRVKGGEYGALGFTSMGYAKNLRIQSSGNDGFYSENSYLLTLDDIWSVNNGDCGFNFRGFHTSIKMGRCFASGNVNAPGFQCNAMIYSSMVTCASDANKWGYSFTNIKGFSMIGCGSESNFSESILMRASNSIAAGALQESADITAFNITGGYFMHGNKTGADGSVASMIGATAEDGRKIDVTLISTASLKNPEHPTDPTIAASATAGSIARFRGLGNSFDAPNVFGGAGTAEFVGS